MHRAVRGACSSVRCSATVSSPLTRVRSPLRASVDHDLDHDRDQHVRYLLECIFQQNDQPAASRRRARPARAQGASVRSRVCSTGSITRCALRCIRRRRRGRCSGLIPGLSARLLASLRTRLLHSEIAGLISLLISASRQHRLTVLPHRRPGFRLAPRQSKVERFGDLGDRIAPCLARGRRRQPTGDRGSAFPAGNIEQPFHGVVHRPRQRNPARRGQRLERIRLAGRNARMHPDRPLPDDHRYLHAASVRNASRSR